MNEFYQMVQKVKGSCSSPCSNYDVSFGFPFTRDAKEDEDFFNRTMAFFKIQPVVQIQKQVYSYGFVSMIAEIGGYTGLLLGVSVLDISKMLNSYMSTILSTRIYFSCL